MLRARVQAAALPSALTADISCPWAYCDAGVSWDYRRYRDSMAFQVWGGPAATPGVWLYPLAFLRHAHAPCSTPGRPPQRGSDEAGRRGYSVRPAGAAAHRRGAPTRQLRPGELTMKRVGNGCLACCDVTCVLARCCAERVGSMAAGKPSLESRLDVLVSSPPVALQPHEWGDRPAP